MVLVIGLGGEGAVSIHLARFPPGSAQRFEALERLGLLLLVLAPVLGIFLPAHRRRSGRS